MLLLKSILMLKKFNFQLISSNCLCESNYKRQLFLNERLYINIKDMMPILGLSENRGIEHNRLTNNVLLSFI